MGSPGRPLNADRALTVDRYGVTDILPGRNTVSSIAFKPRDSDILVSGSWDKSIKVWHLPSGKCQATFEGHRYTFSAITCMGSLGDPSPVTSLPLLQMERSK